MCVCVCEGERERARERERCTTDGVLKKPVITVWFGVTSQTKEFRQLYCKHNFRTAGIALETPCTAIPMPVQEPQFYVGIIRQGQKGSLSLPPTATVLCTNNLHLPNVTRNMHNCQTFSLS